MTVLASRRLWPLPLLLAMLAELRLLARPPAPKPPDGVAAMVAAAAVLTLVVLMLAVL